MTSKPSEMGYILDRACGGGCPCRQQEHFTHLNLVGKRMENGVGLPSDQPEIKWINIRGREEHEAIISNAEWCEELGLDQAYEIMIYLKRWGSWLGE